MVNLSVGERIRNYRSILQITQKELAGRNLSPNYIYMLENNMKSITPKSAMFIAERIEYFSKEKNIKLSVGINDLLLSETQYAEKLCLEKLYDLNKSFSERACEDILSISKKYSLNNITTEVLAMLGEFYYKNRDYTKSIECLNLIKEFKEDISGTLLHIGVLNRIGTCYYMLNEDDIAFEYLNKSYDEFQNSKIQDDKLKFKVTFNLALYYEKTKQYETALSLNDILLDSLKLDHRQLSNTLLLRGNIYGKQNKSDEAIEIYERLLREDEQNRYIYLNNISIELNKLGRKEESSRYLNEAINIQLKLDLPTTTSSFIQLGRNCRSNKNFKQAIHCFDCALRSSKKYSQLDKRTQCYFNLLETYKENKQVECFIEYASEINELIEEHADNYLLRLKLYLILIDYYIESKQTLLAQKLIKDINERGD